MKKNEEILKDSPDYEEYTENEVKLSKEQMIEFGMIKCGGCCRNKGITLIKTNNNKKN